MLPVLLSVFNGTGIVRFYWYRYCCQIIMNLEFSRQILEKFRNMKFNENPSNRSRVVICGQTDGRKNRQEDMSKLTVAFPKFARAPKNVKIYGFLERATLLH